MSAKSSEALFINTMTEVEPLTARNVDIQDQLPHAVSEAGGKNLSGLRPGKMIDFPSSSSSTEVWDSNPRNRFKKANPNQTFIIKEHAGDGSDKVPRAASVESLPVTATITTNHNHQPLAVLRAPYLYA